MSFASLNHLFMKHHYSFAKMVFLFLLSFILYQTLQAQITISISGKIVDSVTQQPVISASITVRNKNISAASKTDGTFSIQASLNDELTITYIGYQNKTVIADGSYLTIAIAPSSATLNDVVVTALGIRKDVKRLGYSVQTVNGSDLVKARESNPINSLAGKLAGLNVGINQEILASPTVLLRGSPLNFYVVDGIPINSDTWNISPDDIETYTVLKGPTAAALYGSRGINGAILITTKRGNKNRKGFTVEVNSSNQINKGFIAISKVQNEYGGGDNQQYAFGDYLSNGTGAGRNDKDYDVWGPRFSVGAGTGNGGKIPLRYQYPTNETTANSANLAAALKSQYGGNDDINAAMWLIK